MTIAGTKKRQYRMKVPRYSKPRPNRNQLYRRAALLDVSPSHLSRVLSGKRESASLLLRWNELLEAEARAKTKPLKNRKPTTGKAATSGR
jgi:hypothetical protein